MAILGVFGKLCFSPFLVTKTQMCLTGSITSENKGGSGGGSDPLRKISITNPLFLFDGFPNTGCQDTFQLKLLLAHPDIDLDIEAPRNLWGYSARTARQFAG